MADLSPAKILVVLVIALFVLGPDKLPRAARQAGRLATDFRRFRDGLHAELREAFGDPKTLSALPGRGQTLLSQAGINSVTTRVLSATGLVETSTPQGGPWPGGVPSQAPPGSGSVAEASSAGPVTGVAGDDPDGSGFEPGFN